ncbi:MAG: hypothetical protein IJC16_01280 [Rikenellaceae bacterium]|nr:hypothetical protein [Rikenellaceae bacterium]
MINILINNIGYTCPTSWDDITLAQAVRLESLSEQLSGAAKDALAEVYEPSAMRETADPGVQAELETFGEKIFGLLCGVPDQTVLATEPEHIRELVGRYLLRFAAGMIFEPDYVPRRITSFAWNGETLHLPRTDIDLAGMTMPMADASAAELCGATDLYNAGRGAQAAMIVAMLCRPEGEPYDERRAKERARTMTGLPMSIAMEVFFCLPQRTIT